MNKLKFYEVKALCQFLSKDQSEKPTNEIYLLQAEDCADAQLNHYERVASECWSDPVVVSVSRSTISAVLGDRSCTFTYRVKNFTETINARNGKPKAIVKYVLVYANNIANAVVIAHESNEQDELLNWQIENVVRVTFTDVLV